MPFIVFAAGIVVSCVLTFYVYRKFVAHRLFKREGISGPEPHWLAGNLIAFIDKNNRYLVLPNWAKKYGKVYGYYEGSKPVLAISDPEIVSQVFIKQFPAFNSRQLIPLQPDPDSPNYPANMFMSNGERWKRLRMICSPIFTSGKMRAMMPLMDKCQRDFMALMDEKAAAKSSFDIYECSKLLTLDTISETAFGIELNSAKTHGKEHNHVLEVLEEAFRNLYEVSWVFKLGMMLNEAERLLFHVENLRSAIQQTGGRHTAKKIVSIVEQMVNERRKAFAQNKRQDLLQMMLEVEESIIDPAVLNGMKGLSVPEIIGQVILFLMAGFEVFLRF